MVLKIKATKVLKKTLDAEKAGFKIICHEGGSRSSKTWSIFQFFILKALHGDKISLTIVREKLTWIKSTLLQDFKQIVDQYGLKITPEVNPNRPEQTYVLNGSEFSFFGLDYTEKLHGRRQDWFWINEAMEVTKAEFDQLEMRTSIGGILDYNPANDEHWVFQLEKRPDVTFIKSTILDNPFAPKAVVDKIKSYEPTEENIKRGTADNFMWEVYGCGKRARLQGVVFEKWDVVDAIPGHAKLLGYGMDFGYTNHPTALVGLYTASDEIYFRQLIYKTGLNNQEISQELKSLKVNPEHEIYCDSAEPKSIDELHAQGWNTFAVQKGADSINYGIDIMKSHKIHIEKGSSDLEAEIRGYKWAEDRSGKRLNKPVDFKNHAIDAARYVAMMKLATPKEEYANIDFF